MEKIFATYRKMKEADTFKQDCDRCPRLSRFLADVRHEYPDYHARPVAPFGAEDPGLLIVGLAPGLHGANATGRPFTGDYAGILLYETLHEFGFSNQSEATSRDDGLVLNNCRITNAVKCLPPQNKPVGSEISNCNAFLKKELAELKSGAVVLALGSIAHTAVVKALDLKPKDYKFSHGKKFPLPEGRWLLDSYHCSRYNTQTKRLTKQMFQDVFQQAVKLLEVEAK
jgi:uracil-DNA glycosylase family 4